jgi:hypothetical protein
MRKVCGVVWCYVGSEEEAARAMKPLLDAVPEPLMHGVASMPHPALQSAFDGLYPAGEQWYWRADFVREVPDDAVEIHARFGADMPTLKSTMHLYPIDGAAHDVAASDTAWSYRDATFNSVFAGVDPDPANAEAIRQWSVDYFEALHPHSARWRLREHDDGRRPRAGARELPRQLRPPGAHQGDLRPRQPVPRQPEHRAGPVGLDAQEATQ